MLPANSALTNGTGTFSATLKTAGTQIITATDTVTSSVTGSSGNITVSAGSAAAISAFSGSGQNTTVGMAFANPLVALVQDGFGNPVSGVAVTFAAPNSGPSGTFNNSLTNIVAATDATGHAGTTFTANTVAGVYAVTASTSGVATSASFSLANLAGAITHLALSPATATITAGGNQVFMAEGLDYIQQSRWRRYERNNLHHRSGRILRNSEPWQQYMHCYCCGHEWVQSHSDRNLHEQCDRER